MVRLLLFLALLCLVALGLAWIAEHPGDRVAFALLGYRVETYLTVVIAGVAVLAIALWSVLLFVLRAPTLVALTRRARRREKGFTALSRGMVAIGCGAARTARPHAPRAHPLSGAEPPTRPLPP